MPLWIRIIRLALPSIATFSSMTLTGMLTLVIIGRLGPAAIAVCGITNIFMYNMWALFAGINESISYLVSQNYGEKTMTQGNQRMQVALLLTLALDLLWFIACMTLSHEILVWIGANHTLITAGTLYVKVRMLAFSFSMFNNLFFAYMRAVGDTRTPMVIALITNVLLIVLTYVMTYGGLGIPKLGLNGAAWSMVITEALSFLFSILVFYGLYHKRFQTRTWHPIQLSLVRLIAWESVKLSLMELCMSIGMLVFTACITRLGTVAVAANEMALNILSLGFMPANGFGAAATIIVGQEVGAMNPLEARRGGLYTVGLGLVFMALFSVFLWLFALPVAKMYTSDPAVYILAVSLIHIASFIQLFDGAAIIFSGGLRGCGDTTYLFRASLLVNWVVFIPMTILLTSVFHFGQAGAWISLCTLIVLYAVANAIRYLKMDWVEVRSLSVGAHM